MIRTVRFQGRAIQYELVQTVRSSMEIRVTPKGTKVFAPKGIRLSLVDDFVLSRADWLLEAGKKLEDYRLRHHQAHPVEEGSPILVGGRVCRLHYTGNRKDEGLKGEILTVFLAPEEDPRQAVRALLIGMAREQIEKSLARYVPLVGRSPGRVAIRDQKTRWGSCSDRGNVNFNYKLVMAPGRALDYVVIHELCHLYELNHSRRFWDRVASFMPDYQDWIKWLKVNGPMLGV